MKNCDLCMRPGATELVGPWDLHIHCVPIFQRRYLCVKPTPPVKQETADSASTADEKLSG